MKNIINQYKHNIRNVIKTFSLQTYENDIEQEVYIKIWKNSDKYNEQGRILGWIKAIATNTCKDFVKSKKYIQKDCFEDEDKLVNIADHRTPEIAISSKERQKIILDAINTLKPKLKEIIILYDINEMSYEEISSTLKCPIGTVKSRLFNARKILSEELTDLI